MLRLTVRHDPFKCATCSVFCIYEAIIRYKGFKEMGLLRNGFIYVLKPLIVGLFPNNILWEIFKRS